MPKMKAVQVSAPGAEFELVEREIPYAPCRPRQNSRASLRNLS